MAPEIIISSHERKRRAPISSVRQPPCGVCKVNTSRYTCPHCNLHYCTLACFRSETHASCSETFARRSLQEDIEGAKDKTGEEKSAMLAMLRKFEEESLKVDEGAEESEEEDEGDRERSELEKRLGGVDLDALSPDDLLALLSPTQRDAFDTTLRDPTLVSALVAAEFQPDLPWWINEESDEEEEEDLASPAGRPRLIDVKVLPVLKLGDDGKMVARQELVFNIVAVLFAYAYVLRTFSLTSFSSLPPGSTERATAIAMFSQLLPFLLEKSTLVLGDVGAAVEYVVSREKQDSLAPQLLALLLTDVDVLLRPSPITTVDSLDTDSLSSHPLATTLAALSDLHGLFTFDLSSKAAPSIISRPTRLPSKTPTAGAAQKLLFYTAFLALPTSPISPRLLGAMGQSMRVEAERRVRDGVASEARIQSRKEARETPSVAGTVEEVEEGQGEAVIAPRIVEIP